ncbi:helix-turn-helix transcriptional regulator [Radicibacter daui]|uniref:helix-turn-helix transcriptional regulator n=1 Tax=Radicibacter daui TaxID=3064829 RepID=UPI004046AEC6
MRRADRLFELIQCLRRHREQPVTAAILSAELEVSERTIYRDIAALQAQRVPVYGEAGVGYVLRDGYDLPALMFTEDEIEALVLGARIVQTHADPELGRAAGDVLAKIEAVVTDALRPRIRSMALLAPSSSWAAPPAPRFDVARLRRAVRDQRKVRLLYTDRQDQASERVIWPQSLAFFPPLWIAVGWCELRQDFRSFRLDRVQEMIFLEERYPDQPGRRLTDYLKLKKHMRAAPPEGDEAPEAGFIRR